MFLEVKYSCLYLYEKGASGLCQEIRFFPKQQEYLKVLSWDMASSLDVRKKSFSDENNNQVLQLFYREPFEWISIGTYGLIELNLDNQVGLENPYQETRYEDWMRDISLVGQSQRSQHAFNLGLSSHLKSSPLTQMTELLEAWRSTLCYSYLGQVPLALWIGQAVHEAISYEAGSTSVFTCAQEAFLQRKGVCQDYAHLMIALLRSFNIPCRYIAGIHYEENRSTSSLHAWVRYYDYELGREVSFDPTAGSFTTARYIPISEGEDTYAVAPVRGCCEYQGAELAEWFFELTPVKETEIDSVLSEANIQDNLQRVLRTPDTWDTHTVQEKGANDNVKSASNSLRITQSASAIESLLDESLELQYMKKDYLQIDRS